MAYNYGKLKGRIREVFDTDSAFAKAMGKSNRTISLKLNNKINFDQDEIVQACSSLRIPMAEMPAYFFNVDVQ